MKRSIEKKGDVRALAVLGLVMADAIYRGFFSDSMQFAPAKARVAAPSDTAPSDASVLRSAAGHGRTDEFLPMMHRKNSDGKKSDPIKGRISVRRFWLY